MPAFQFSLSKRLRALGLEGTFAWAMIHDGALQLQDAAQLVVRLGPADTSRVRIGYFDAKHRSYHTRVWRVADERALELVPTKETWPAYRETIAEFAQLLAQADRLHIAETGTSKFDALFGPALMLIPTLGALALALFVLTDEPWWGRAIIPIAPTIILLVLIWLGVKRYWPRTVRSVTDLLKLLPPG